jgi:hypothetical protein
LTSWEHYGGKDKQYKQGELSKYKSRGVCHIDGAMAVLKLRQQWDPLNERSLNIDKLYEPRYTEALEYPHG